MAGGVITLAEMRAKGMVMLEVACRQLRAPRPAADRAAHCRARVDLRAIIAADCPRMKNPAPSMYERCGVHFPELPSWFLTH